MKSIKILGKVTFTGRVDKMLEIDKSPNGVGKKRVVLDPIDITSGYALRKSYVNVFPEDFAEKHLMDAFFSVDRIGKRYKFEGVAYEYPRKDGSLSYGIKDIRPIR